MAVNRRVLLLVLLVATAWLGWSHLRGSIEIVTLFARGPDQDHYVRLWIVDEGNQTWVRAERPDRLWLDALRESPNATLWRDGTSLPVRAVIWNGHGSKEHVDRLFRARYGPLDAVAGFLWRRDSVPIRLERR